MATKISWADATWNPIIGCSKISAGCANCYAERMAYRQSCMEATQNCFRTEQREIYCKVVYANRGWNGKTHFVESVLTKPLHWRNPCKIFVCSMSDLFHESVPFEWIDRVFAIMSLRREHRFMLLTKRSKRMLEYTKDKYRWADHILPEVDKIQSPMQSPCQYQWPLRNVHLGVTVENQDNVGRIADLIKTPAAKRFISFEPLLEETCFPANINDAWDRLSLKGIDYAFIGCESGSKARLCSLVDIGNLTTRLRRIGIKVHVKQIPLNGKCNKDITQWPEEFQIREV